MKHTNLHLGPSMIHPFHSTETKNGERKEEGKENREKKQKGQEGGREEKV